MNNPQKVFKSIPKPTHFGENLKLLRKMKGLSQSQLAKQIGMSRNNIASYESGMVEPRAMKFLAACKYFNISPEVMLQEVLSNGELSNHKLENKSSGIIDTYFDDQMEQFVAQTNEMTKIIEGYEAYMEMQKDTLNYKNNTELYATLYDLLELLNTLVDSNWELIQGLNPQSHDEQGS